MRKLFVAVGNARYTLKTEEGEGGDAKCAVKLYLAFLCHFDIVNTSRPLSASFILRRGNIHRISRYIYDPLRGPRRSGYKYTHGDAKRSSARSYHRRQQRHFVITASYFHLVSTAEYLFYYARRETANVPTTYTQSQRFTSQLTPTLLPASLIGIFTRARWICVTNIDDDRICERGTTTRAVFTVTHSERVIHVILSEIYDRDYTRTELCANPIIFSFLVSPLRYRKHARWLAALNPLVRPFMSHDNAQRGRKRSRDFMSCKGAIISDLHVCFH